SNPVQYIKPAPPTIGTLIDDVPTHPGIRDIAVTPDGQHAYITNPAENTVTVMTLNPPGLLTTLSTGWQPQGIAILPDRASASGGQSVAISADGTRMFVVTVAGVLVELDVKPGSPTRNQVIKKTNLGSGGQSVAITADGTILLVLLTNGDLLVVDVTPGSATKNQVIKKTN